MNPYNLFKFLEDKEGKEIPIKAKLIYAPETLPDNLTVRGNLYLGNTPIQSFPDNLTVKGSLFLNNTPIESLPNNLTVEGNLFLHNTPISNKYTKEEIKKMVPGVKGDIRI